MPDDYRANGKTRRTPARPRTGSSRHDESRAARGRFLRTVSEMRCILIEIADHDQPRLVEWSVESPEWISAPKSRAAATQRAFRECLRTITSNTRRTTRGESPDPRSGSSPARRPSLASEGGREPNDLVVTREARGQAQRDNVRIAFIGVVEVEQPQTESLRTRLGAEDKSRGSAGVFREAAAALRACQTTGAC